MKRKNLKSIIHNFAHSFQAFDFRISQYPLLIQLCWLYKKHGANWVEVDILKNSIQPDVAVNREIKQRIQDYSDWLPELCLSQNADPKIIKELKIRVTIDFDSATVFKSSRNERVLQVKTDYLCIDDLGNILEDSIVESEVVKKQNYENYQQRAQAEAGKRCS